MSDTKCKCKVVTVMGEIRLHIGESYVRLTIAQANELSVMLAEAANVAGMAPVGCYGPCVELDAWCPECDGERRHIRISQFCIECCECGELSDTTTSETDE